MSAASSRVQCCTSQTLIPGPPTLAACVHRPAMRVWEWDACIGPFLVLSWPAAPPSPHGHIAARVGLCRRDGSSPFVGVGRQWLPGAHGHSKSRTHPSQPLHLHHSPLLIIICLTYFASLLPLPLSVILFPCLCMLRIALFGQSGET